MTSAAFAAILLFFQAAPGATPTPVKTASVDTGHSVSGVTVTPKTPKSEAAAKNTVVCRNEPVLGSLFPKKVCATVGQNAERRKNDQEIARDFQRSVIVGKQVPE